MAVGLREEKGRMWSMPLTDGLETRVKQHQGLWIEELVCGGVIYHDGEPKEEICNTKSYLEAA